MVQALLFLLGLGIAAAAYFAGLWLLLVYPGGNVSLRGLWWGLGVGFGAALAFIVYDWLMIAMLHGVD